jgi:hypothetical protein
MAAPSSPKRQEAVVSSSVAPSISLSAADDFLRRTRRWLRYRRELAGFVIDVLCVLVSERATGRLTINLTRGCAASAEFENNECEDTPLDAISLDSQSAM